MSKFAMEKKSVVEKAFDEQVEHKHVPGVAYEVTDPATKLIYMIGGGFFNEPKYYDTNRSEAAFYAELQATGKISSTIKDEQGLTEQAREVLETAVGVANSANPEDLLVIASWARDTENGLKLRTTPQIMLVVAAAHPKTRHLVAKYGDAIMRRADEPRQVFAAFRHLYQQGNDDAKGLHKGSLPHGLRKALALAYAKQSDYSLLKYNSDERPQHADVLKMLRGDDIRRFLRKQGKQLDHWPVSKAMFEYLVNGKYVEDGLPDILAARKEFFALKKTDAESLSAEAISKLVKAAGLTWENITSQLGSTAKIWEVCIPLMGEMALTRNLRNFEQAKISREAWDQVYKKLESVESTVQLPFRFFTAAKQTTSTEAKSAAAMMLDRAVATLPDLPGRTLVLTDNSGSALGCPVSGKSDLRVADCGNTLEAIFAKRLGRRCKIGVFGDVLIYVPFNQADSTLAIKEMIDSHALSIDRSKLVRDKEVFGVDSYMRGSGVGGGTETGVFWSLWEITNNKERFDRIVIQSDFCCYTQGNARIAGAGDMAKFGGRSANIQGLLDKYRREVNKDVQVYSINLSGHGQAQMRPGDDKTHLLSGWSEKLVSMILEIEGYDAKPAQENAETPVPPSLAVLRERYKRA